MNARVGAPGTLRQDLFAGDSSNSRGQRSLDGGGIRLYLPSQKVGAVVSENDFEIAHEERLGIPRAPLVTDASPCGFTPLRGWDAKEPHPSAILLHSVSSFIATRSPTRDRKIETWAAVYA